MALPQPNTRPRSPGACRRAGGQGYWRDTGSLGGAAADLARVGISSSPAGTSEHGSRQGCSLSSHSHSHSHSHSGALASSRGVSSRSVFLGSWKVHMGLMPSPVSSPSPSPTTSTVGEHQLWAPVQSHTCGIWKALADTLLGHRVLHIWGRHWTKVRRETRKASVQGDNVLPWETQRCDPEYHTAPSASNKWWCCWCFTT